MGMKDVEDIVLEVFSSARDTATHAAVAANQKADDVLKEWDRLNDAPHEPGNGVTEQLGVVGKLMHYLLVANQEAKEREQEAVDQLEQATLFFEANQHIAVHPYFIEKKYPMSV